MSKVFQAKDHFDKTWLVYEGDVAWANVSKLDKAGVSRIVLPRDAYLTGEVPDTSTIDLTNFSADLFINEDVNEFVIDQVRLQDCIQFLKENNEENP